MQGLQFSASCHVLASIPVLCLEVIRCSGISTAFCLRPYIQVRSSECSMPMLLYFAIPAPVVCVFLVVVDVDAAVQVGFVFVGGVAQSIIVS